MVYIVNDNNSLYVFTSESGARRYYNNMVLSYIQEDDSITLEDFVKVQHYMEDLTDVGLMREVKISKYLQDNFGFTEVTMWESEPNARMAAARIF